MLYAAEFPRSTTCWLAGPEFFGWPLIQPGEEVQADLAPLREDTNKNIPGCAVSGPLHQRWRRDALRPLEILQPRQERDTCVHTPEGGLRRVSWNTRGFLAPQPPLRSLENKSLQETHRKDEILQAL